MHCHSSVRLLSIFCFVGWKMYKPLKNWGMFIITSCCTTAEIFPRCRTPQKPIRKGSRRLKKSQKMVRWGLNGWSGALNLILSGIALSVRFGANVSLPFRRRGGVGDRRRGAERTRSQTGISQRYVQYLPKRRSGLVSFYVLCCLAFFPRAHSPFVWSMTVQMAWQRSLAWLQSSLEKIWETVTKGTRRSSSRRSLLSWPKTTFAVSSPIQRQSWREPGTWWPCRLLASLWSGMFSGRPFRSEPRLTSNPPRKAERWRAGKRLHFVVNWRMK